MATISAWLVSFRLRTLPLALSTIIVGSFLAAFHHQFKWSVFILAVLTTLFLQILSNLANDYGDTKNGVDNQDRQGPKRSLQTGAITLSQMKIAIIIFISLSLISGVGLIFTGTKGLHLSYGWGFFVLGIAAIIAAMKYTMGKNPYGYAGLGDVFVFIFFGLVGTIGTYFLHTHEMPLRAFLPAMTMGFFSTGVLNLNNIRDKDNDALHGKNTLVVKAGIQVAKYYHAALLIAGMFCTILYSLKSGASIYQWIYLPAFVGIIRSIKVVNNNENPAALDVELKYLALSTLIFALLFGVGLLV